MIHSGRHKSRSFQYVMDTDRDYCGFLVDALHKKRPLPHDLKQLAKCVEVQEGGVLRVGSYTNKFFREVWYKHRDLGDISWTQSFSQPHLMSILAYAHLCLRSYWTKVSMKRHLTGLLSLGCLVKAAGTWHATLLRICSRKAWLSQKRPIIKEINGRRRRTYDTEENGDEALGRIAGKEETPT